MNQTFIIILLLLGIVLFYITKNREGFLNYRKSCVVKESFSIFSNIK